ncbi:MAG: hypothetical protein HUU41_11740 [Bryobacteraceae bacterium]|nr:DUF6454 family protein [Bryobacterales bacterium]MEB2359925.1 DUF6454 family protein [Bryobacterales bacterium]NUN01778.1 hypothetical protein [Bryobacteraceae bacterium]
MRFLLAILPLSVMAADHAGNLQPLQTVELHAETHHVQGIDVEGGTLWVSAVDTRSRRGLLFRFDRKTGKLLHSAEVHSGERYHPGGISIEGGSVWVPVAEYRPSSTTSMQKRHRGTFALQAEFDINDHIGAVAIVPEGLVGANWDAREFYVWRKTGERLRRVANPSGIAIQDMKFVNGRLIASGLGGDGRGAVIWLEWPRLKELRRMYVGRTDRGVAFTHEGLAIHGRTLYLLPEDGPSRLFRFEIPGTAD